MIIQSLLYKVVAISVSLGMLIQVYVPTLVGPVPQPADRPADGLAEVLETAVGPELAPDGYLLDAGARQPANVFPTEPDALANPISLSRVQSAYVPGDAINNTLIVTFTVTNNRPPTIFPDVPPGTPITDTVALLAGFDFTADPNTIRGVALSDSLLGTAVLLDASPQPSRDGANLLFNLGDVPPSASVTATLTLQVPAAVADFTNLDSGAAAYGMLQGRAVSVATAPALLAPDSFGQYLRWTPDADIYDAEMLRQLGDLGADPVDLFAYVRGFGYESYEGSLRGTRGTLWSEAGSSMDQASLLIAMLRASGVPARYAQGTLNTPLAQELILSMFPEPVRVVGRIAPGVETADPANDPALLAETQDHWWVQAYLNGAWVDLDPSFAAAQPGDAFAPVGQTHAEVPDALRHKVTLSVKVERIEPFDFTLADYAVTYPLTATFNTVALAGRPLLFAHFVQTDIQGGVFSNYFHTYTPYFVVGNYERLVQGEAFQDLLTNFPFGSAFVSGVWLTVDSIAPNGQTESYTRELKDIIGPAARQPTGFVNVDVNGNRGDPALPLLTQTDVMQIHVVPQTRTPAYETARLTSEIAEYGPQIAAAFDAATQLVVNPDEDAYVAFLNAHQPLILTAQYASLAFLGTTYHVRASAPEREFRSDAMLVRSYPARPKLILIAQSAFTSTTSTSFELLSISEKALAYPGQASDAAFSANLLRTIDDKMLEYQLMEEVFNTRPNSALTVFDEAIQNNADFALITPSTLNALASLAISDEAKGRINAAVTSGSSVYVPTEMVLVDGTPTIGWLEVAPTGDATFVTEDGRHAVDAGEAAILAAIIGGVAVIIAAGIGAAGAVVAALIAAFAAIVLAIAQVIAAGAAGMRLPAGASPATNVSSDVVLAIAQTSREAVAACHGQPGVNCADVVALLSPMQLAGAVASPQSPLADAWFSEAPAVADVPFASSPVAVTGSVAGTNLTAAVSTDVTALTDPATADWTTTAVSPFAFDSLTAANATLFDANGVQLASGSVAVGPSRSAAAQGSGLDASLSGLAGGLTFHAPAASGLAAGSQWLTYPAALDDAQPYTIALDDAAVMVNNSSTFTGALTLEISGPASLTGGGATAVPA
ncbi:MAG: transglutaminase family protein, partial [Anaerolineales bacterium]|nr:transglutaminase family protein [Anaerolineales bacterium]